MTAPPMAYYGGKTLLADRIVAALPAHRGYLEPFAGGLSVLLAKPRARHETVSDIDGDLMVFWRALRDQPDDLARVCALTPHSRAEYALARDLPKHASDLERARRVWVQITQSRTGTRSGTGWRHYVDPWGSNTNMPGYLAGYVQRMAAAAERLAGVSLESRPALELIEAHGHHEDTLIYADPPYLGSTRTGTNYAHEMASESDHRDLAVALRRCRAAVVLSGYDSDLYRDLYAGWRTVQMDTTTSQGGQVSPRTEVLWCNRPSESHLFSAPGGDS